VCMRSCLDCVLPSLTFVRFIRSRCKMQDTRRTFGSHRRCCEDILTFDLRGTVHEHLNWIHMTPNRYRKVMDFVEVDM